MVTTAQRVVQAMRFINVLHDVGAVVNCTVSSGERCKTLHAESKCLTSYEMLKCMRVTTLATRYFYAVLLPRRGRILRRTLSVRLSVRPSRYCYRASRRAT